jgi:hypothetical protein
VTGLLSTPTDTDMQYIYRSGHLGDEMILCLIYFERKLLLVGWWLISQNNKAHRPESN